MSKKVEVTIALILFILAIVLPALYVTHLANANTPSAYTHVNNSTIVKQKKAKAGLFWIHMIFSIICGAIAFWMWYSEYSEGCP